MARIPHIIPHYPTLSHTIPAADCGKWPCLDFLDLEFFQYLQQIRLPGFLIRCGRKGSQIAVRLTRTSWPRRCCSAERSVLAR